MVTDERRRIAQLLGLGDDGTASVQAGLDGLTGSALDRHAAAAPAPLIVRALRKEFDTPMGLKVAVSDMNYALNPGEVLGMVGPNGCGKSTSFACISATIPATAGDAWVGGHHVDRDPTGVHLSLGLCPQHSVLWDDLSVEDHLFFYARLKGVEPEGLQVEVNNQLEAVDLAAVRKRAAGQLSGGMRRRLSTAISLTGRSVLSYLDEPTAGLDLASRRRLWRVIERAKRLPSHTGRPRSMVLTSHSMDECELLSDRIAIVCDGRVRVIGTPQALRNRFGQGYRLFVNYERDSSGAVAAGGAAAGVAERGGKVLGRERAVGLIARLFPTASIDQDYQGYASFLVPTGGMPLSNMFRLMHDNAREGGITDWGVGQVTLEDVFARVVHAYDGTSEAASGSGDS